MLNPFASKTLLFHSFSFTVVSLRDILLYYVKYCSVVENKSFILLMEFFIQQFITLAIQLC